MKLGIAAPDNGRIGEDLAVTVTIDPAGDPDPVRAWVWLWWMAEGGSDALDPVVVAHEIALPAAAEGSAPRRLDLVLRAPEGPPSFQGDTVQVRWVVSVRAARPEGSSAPEIPGAHQRIRMAPARRPWTAPDALAARLAHRDAGTQDERDLLAYARLLGAVGIGLLVLLGLFELGREAAAHGRSGGLALVLALLALVGVGAAGPIRRDLDRLRQRRRRASAAHVVALGGSVTLSGLPGAELRLVRIEESARDEVVNRRGASGRRRVWYTRETGIDGDQLVDGRGTLRLPRQGPPSLETDTRRIRWEARADRRIVPVVVLPWLSDASVDATSASADNPSNTS